MWATRSLGLIEVDNRRHPLVWTEQLMPVLPLVRVRNADEAIDLAMEAEHGFRHTATMHSKHLDHLSRMARECNASIFVKNGPTWLVWVYGVKAMLPCPSPAPPAKA